MGCFLPLTPLSVTLSVSLNHHNSLFSLGRGFLLPERHLPLQLCFSKCDPSWGFPGGPVVKNLPSIARGTNSIPDQGAKVSHTLWPKKQKQYCNKFNKDF